VIEGAHLVRDETGAARSGRRARCCDNTTNAGRREAANAMLLAQGLRKPAATGVASLCCCKFAAAWFPW
jgi:hypothetical protein